MQNGAGAARLICVFTACILLLGYNFYGRFLKPSPAVQAVIPELEKREITSSKSSTSAPEKTESRAETISSASSDSTESGTKSETSVAASAKGGKGKNYKQLYIAL